MTQTATVNETVKAITPDSFTRINNDINGNPRYVCHYLRFQATDERISYETALCRAKQLGGGKFHNKQYGGGIVFQSYSLESLCNDINKLMNNYEMLRHDLGELLAAMMDSSDYVGAADFFLFATETKLSVKYVGYGKHFAGDTDSRHIFKFTLSNSKGRYSGKFGQSIANGKKYPTAYDILACINKYEVGDFDFFCSNYGYDNDSRTAYKIFKACVKEWKGVCRLWNEDQIQALQIIN